jgi:hypothetical protein
MSDLKIKLIQTNVTAVTDISKQNLEKLMQRDVKLGDLEKQSEELSLGAKRFEHMSRKLKSTMCCKNAKYAIVTVCVVILSIILIILISQPWKHHRH